jgi:hypothetical protein
MTEGNRIRTVDDWRGDPLPIRRSRGSAVPYVEDWQRNVLRASGSGDWPDFLLRQVRAYVARRGGFADEDAAALAAQLGRISKFQSLRSEDALTWSWFGTLHDAKPESRRAAIQWLCNELPADVEVSDEVEVRQWVRVPHPNVAGRLGPEVDAIIDDPDGVLVYVEAKWDAELGTGKGSSDGLLDDQIVLRCRALAPPAVDATRPRVVLGLSRATPDISTYDVVARETGVTVCWLTWADLARCAQHPLAIDFPAYLAWKTRLSEA